MEHKPTVLMDSEDGIIKFQPEGLYLGVAKMEEELLMLIEMFNVLDASLNNN